MLFYNDQLHYAASVQGMQKQAFQLPAHAKNLGRLWLAYTEFQADFTCYNSYLLTLCALHCHNKDVGWL